ncbi:flavin-containing monooxygenase [Novosphingobium mangrovi (ex Hu et al. 2023)]|uniref:NAD(P)/FAD-dependent oxidoreductase n=1 Tax=Novosphingobium mangrovi (ex Hu et al. 2023) TaxID=2930094 RepID=A0ABT0AEQ3_9SPHN|nr:NAD(P)/FAD-dependent oxidoreductase [Novosphingobium mangrovi (ex Hu et al. 2023)]MCJ1961672.1 NAD(P)/FAD-dependent oxidoreductase [Novosphingobium mangrovi (ex Hu et al. 2023)]
MALTKSNVPPIADIDVAAMNARYAKERERRLRKGGQADYVPPKGALPDVAKDPDVEIVPRPPITGRTDVVVLGCGFGGTLAGVQLARQGVSDFLMLDTAGDFGGVWYWNRYPGIQCDNDAYCYLPLLEETGFVPSKKFADGWEIQGYIRQIAEQFGFADKAVFQTQVTSLVWDEGAARWQVGTNRGDRIEARFVIMANGVLNMPKLPALEGIDAFKGKLFHTARWDYGYTGGEPGRPELDRLADKTVAIVGTGATAIQAVPILAQYARKLYVIQRTPATVDARPNPPTDRTWFESQPPGWQAARQANFQRGAMESFGPGDEDLVSDFWTEISRNIAAELAEEGWPEIGSEEYLARRAEMDHRVMERFRRRVDALVEDGTIGEALKPYYYFMCKRPLSSDTYYPAFNRSNVELVDVSETRGIQKLTENGFVANGTEYPCDCVIFASGFEVTSDLERRWGIDRIEGTEGRSLYDHWREGPLTLHGTMTHGFPNQFYIGYIQGGLNASVTEQFGRQGEHIAWIIGEALRRGAERVEPTRQAMEDYVAHFEATTIDQSDFLNSCPPSYFNNEGAKEHKWGLFRPWGAGWDDFLRFLRDWREAGDMEGLDLRISQEAQ